MTRAEKIKYFSGGEPLAPMCEQYLDLSTLGDAQERKRVTETVIDYFSESSSTTEPVAEAERLVRTLDPVTVNILRVALDGDFFDRRSVNVFLHRHLSGIRVRTYMLLMYGIDDVPARSGSSSFMNGLHQRRQDEGGRDELVIDLSSDDLYRRNVALLRYGVRVTSELEPNETVDMFLEDKFTRDLKLLPEVREIIWDNPDKADRIAHFVIDRRRQDAGLIRELLASGIPGSLSDGII
jgi:hypothetical protein